MPDQIGPAFLITLSSIFGGWGVGEPVAASPVEPLNEWAEKAVIGSGGVALDTLFVAMALRAKGSDLNWPGKSEQFPLL